MEAAYWLLLCFYFSAHCVAGQKPSTDNCSSEDALRLRAVRSNATCGYVTGRVEVCDNGSWKNLCDANWTEQDARVACRQLGYSSIRPTASIILGTQFPNVASFIPVCTGTETNITSCIRQNYSLNSCSKTAEIKCFHNDSTVDICFAEFSFTSTSINGPDPATTTEQGDSTQPSSTSTQATDSTTVTEQGPTEFLTSPTGMVVIAVISSVTLLLMVLLITVIFVVVCKRSPQNKRELARAQVSPRDLEDSLKEDSDGKPGHFDSPGQYRRSTTGNVDIEHHYIEQEGPLYEKVKEVQAPASVSSHDSGRSTSASETNLHNMNYSSLDHYQDMPTYSTLERGQSEYAQVQPFINGSLTRGVALQSPTATDGEDHYHVLDRTSSQGSRLPSSSSSPKTRGKVNMSPKQSRGYHLPSITDDHEEIPEYAELEMPVESNGKNPTRCTVVTQEASPELPPRRSPGQYRRHSNSLSKRPETHERVSPKRLKKSCTLPNTGRTSASTSHQRWSGSIDTTERSNGWGTLVEGRLTSSTQDRIPNSSWV